MLELLLAATLQLPQTTQATARRLSNKAPVLTEENISAAKVELWIDPEGKTKNCKIVRFFGDQRTVDRLCRGAVGTVFEPARDEDGNPAYSLLTLTISAYPEGFHFRADGMKKQLAPTRQSIGLSVQLSELPPELAYDARVPVTLRIDPEGKLAVCQPGNGIETRWTQIACEQAGLLTYDRMTTQEGQPVSYLSSIMVVFEAG